MRCPYCGGLNADRADFCVHCGRDLRARQNQPGSRQPPPQNTYQPPLSSAYPPPAKPVQQPYSAPGRSQVAPQQAPPKPAPVSQTTATSRRTPVAAPAPPAPEPAVPFPPRTMEQLQALEVGALAYSVADTALVVNRKKVVSILYPPCAAWQQVATLLKAYKEQQDDKFATTIIQGYHQQQPENYTFTNGQMTVDCGVLLGSQKINRYQIETDNGFEVSSVRIVLSEPVGAD
jgi:hypothetical protein